MKKAVAVILLAAILAALVGCGQRITQGEVIDKEFTPAHTTVMLVPIVRSNGKKTITTLVPFTYYYSDTYWVTIEAYVDGERKTATYRVTKDVYEAAVIGAEFTYGKGM